MRQVSPDGTRNLLPPEARRRDALVARLQELFDSWGYERIDPPVLEHYDPTHPGAEKAFKLSDRDSGVLALRSDFTPAVARLVRSAYAQEARPLRFQYAGKLWQAIDPDIARTREFSQLGLELIGVSNARADAELIHLARESVRQVGLTPRVELGHPGFVRALLELASVPEAVRIPFANAIDRKDERSVRDFLEDLRPAPDLRRALLGLADLYGGLEQLKAARKLAPWPETAEVLGHVEAILGEFEDDSDLLIDLGMARRLSYYTGVTFRAYTFDFGQPLLGGGRYDGALLPYAAGFAIGLERLAGALSIATTPDLPLVLALDDVAARSLRAAGYRVERALDDDEDAARRYARGRGMAYLLTEAGLEPLQAERPHFAALQTLLEAKHVRS